MGALAWAESRYHYIQFFEWTAYTKNARAGRSDLERLRRYSVAPEKNVTGQVSRPGSHGAEFLDQVVGVSHEALDDAPSLLFGGSDERSDQREILCTLE